MKRASRWRRAPGWWWRGPALALVLVGIGVTLKLAGTGVADVWNAVADRIRGVQ